MCNLCSYEVLTSLEKTWPRPWLWCHTSLGVPDLVCGTLWHAPPHLFRHILQNITSHVLVINADLKVIHCLKLTGGTILLTCWYYNKWYLHTPICPVGTTTNDTCILLCPVGTTASDICILLCPVGTTASDTCILLCPVGTTASDTCILICPVGTTASDTCILLCPTVKIIKVPAKLQLELLFLLFLKLYSREQCTEIICIAVLHDDSRDAKWVKVALENAQYEACEFDQFFMLYFKNHCFLHVP